MLFFKLPTTMALSPPLTIMANHLMKGSPSLCRTHPLMSLLSRIYKQTFQLQRQQLSLRSPMTLIWVKPESPSRMQKRKEKSRTQLMDLPVAQREVLKRDTTYLAKIALVLQDAPGKMLTFTQVRIISNALTI